jgi:hypothetical protein
MQNLKEKWKNSDGIYEIEKSFLDADKISIENLELIRKELVPNCKYPKRMRDRTEDGQWYYMNYNLDL